MLIAAAAFLAAIGVGLAHVSLRLDAVKLGYALGESTRERRRLEEEKRRLLVEKSLLRTPERIERLARDKLGMTRPEPERIRVVRRSGRVLAVASVPRSRGR